MKEEIELATAVIYEFLDRNVFKKDIQKVLEALIETGEIERIVKAYIKKHRNTGKGVRNEKKI